jgi:mRNA interferase RelE/StbE
MYEIIVSKKADKFLSKIPDDDRTRIINAMDKLRIRPEAYVKGLVRNEYYKFRVGNYRLIVDLVKEKLVVLVIKIGHRRNIYK